MNPTVETTKRGRKAVSLQTSENKMKVRVDKDSAPIEVQFSIETLPNAWPKEVLVKLAEAALKQKIRSSILADLKRFDGQYKEACKMRDAAAKMMKLAPAKAQEFFESQGYMFEQPKVFSFSMEKVMGLEESDDE